MCEWCFNLGKRKRGWPHKIWKDEVEDDLNVMDIKTDSSGQKPSEMNTYCIGSQGPKWTVVFEKKEEMSPSDKHVFQFHLNV